MCLNNIYKAGEQLYLSGRHYKNPYRLNSPEFNEFERGWTQAMKRDSVKVGSINHNKSLTEQVQNIAENGHDSLADSYRKLKG